MLGIDRRVVQNFDWVLLGLAAVVSSMGLVNLYSATHTGAELSPEVRRQLLFFGVGAVGLFATAFIDYRHYERLAFPVFAICLVLLASTLVFAPVTRGSRSWLFGGSFQPSEIVKVGMVLALARFFHRNPPTEPHGLRELLNLALIIGLPVGLIVLQRDMGVALLTLFIASTYLVFVNIPQRAWLAVVVVAAASLVGVWNFALAAYQRSRILDVIDPGRDPLSSGYQAMQSRIAIGSGGLFGTGYLEGTQTQLRFLPTQHTDFAFSVLAEEWGFVGSMVALALYLALLMWGLLIARNAKDSFGGMLAIGVVAILFWPAALNIAMVVGLAPVIGVPLPLFSYGGSALVTTLIALGLLLNVSMRRYVF